MRRDHHLPREVRQLLPQGTYGPRIANRLSVTLGQRALPVGEVRIHTSGDDTFSEFKHPHELVMGHYSVHTSLAALAQGEAEIRHIGARLRHEGQRV